MSSDGTNDLNPDDILKRIESLEPDEIEEAELDEIAGGHHGGNPNPGPPPPPPLG